MVIRVGLTINQTNARIGIDRKPGRLEIESRNAVLMLHQKHAKVNIHTEFPIVQIDQYKCFASAGLKGCVDLSREWAQMGRQKVLEYTKKTVNDGNRLAAIEKGRNPIADIAERDAYPVHEFGIDCIPKERPEISVMGGEVDINPERNSEGVNNGVKGKYTRGSVNEKYTPGNVKVYLLQKASMSFKCSGNNVDTFI